MMDIENAQAEFERVKERMSQEENMARALCHARGIRPDRYVSRNDDDPRWMLMINEASLVLAEFTRLEKERG